MPLRGYDVNPEGCAHVLAQVEDDAGRPDALKALQTGMDDAQAAVAGGTGAVACALADLWLYTLVPQADAAEARIANAVAGVRSAVGIIACADQDMAAAATVGLAQVQEHMFREPEPLLDGAY